MDNERALKYRQVLINWISWWNNIGRYHYNYHILPPITATGDVVKCSICSGIEIDGECEICGRTPNE